MSQALGFEVELAMPFEASIERVKSALKEEGFGVLSEIDLRAAFQEKLGKEFRQYMILGACNPPLAYAALTADPSVGLLLPCNVTVESAGDARTIVRLIDPEVMLGGLGASMPAEVTAVAKDARERMVRATESLKR